MAEEARRVAAQSVHHARALADNLTNQGFVVAEQWATHWVLRKPRRRGDIVTTIVIADASAAPPSPVAAQKPWGPPTGPPAS